MPTRKRGHALERWEIALVKAMLATREYNDQEVLAYFTRPTRSINHRAIAEIRTEAKHRAIRVATEAQLDDFLTNWPNIDPETGLSRPGDELLLKAREAMIAAVHCFNGGGLGPLRCGRRRLDGVRRRPVVLPVDRCRYAAGRRAPRGAPR